MDIITFGKLSFWNRRFQNVVFCQVPFPLISQVGLNHLWEYDISLSTYIVKKTLVKSAKLRTGEMGICCEFTTRLYRMPCFEHSRLELRVFKKMITVTSRLCRKLNKKGGKSVQKKAVGRFFLHYLQGKSTKKKRKQIMSN